MSNTVDTGTRSARATTTSVGQVTAIGTGLVAVNILLMFVLSVTPVVALGRFLFSSFFLGVAAFALTVGGGYWLASRGIERDAMGMAAAGVALTQFGYGLFGATVLAFVDSLALRATALAITAVITAVVTAVVVVVVYKTDHSFARWRYYSLGCFVGGFVVGAVGVFVAPLLLAVASLLFFLGFLTDLTYEIWAVKESRYDSTLRNAIGIYVAVMGVFVHILQWVLRALSVLDQ